MLLKKLSIFLKNIFKKAVKWLLILIVPALVLCIAAFPFFGRIRGIECATQYGQCSDQTNSFLKSFQGKTIFSAVREVKKILRKDVFVRDMTVRFAFPDTIKVDLLIKKPSFCINTDDPKRFALIDTGGVVLASTTSCALPKVLTKPAKRISGQTVSETELFSLKIVQGVYEMYQVSAGSLDSDLTVKLGSGVKVIFPVKGDVESLLGALRLIYTKIQKDYPGKYNEIDLRFDSPVLR